ncbi:MAG: TIGR00725 family protein [Actinobacteria bacterium]|nr:TIGR00725 family protein [Actinomycetota bacterium]
MEVRLYISVVGASSCSEEVAAVASELGREIAARGHVLVCGGLAGVMEAVCRGANEAGGITVGILPDIDRGRANRWLTISIPTDMGHARNTLVALSGDAVIAVSGGYGTLSEISFGLKLGKPVIGLHSWRPDPEGREETTVIEASTPEEAVDLAEKLTGSTSKRKAHRPD